MTRTPEQQELRDALDASLKELDRAHQLAMKAIAETPWPEKHAVSYRAHRLGRALADLLEALQGA